mmetsp:Transcript_14139/g.23932  ORF Transcript_14139/g.23932 Transcript_14139/m.23932 type:complete len:206 (+) Transcript_14139:237-854(+)
MSFLHLKLNQPTRHLVHVLSLSGAYFFCSTILIMSCISSNVCSLCALASSFRAMASSALCALESSRCSLASSAMCFLCAVASSVRALVSCALCSLWADSSKVRALASSLRMSMSCSRSSCSRSRSSFSISLSSSLFTAGVRAWTSTSWKAVVPPPLFLCRFSGLSTSLESSRSLPRRMEESLTVPPSIRTWASLALSTALASSCD